MIPQYTEVTRFLVVTCSGGGYGCWTARRADRVWSGDGRPWVTKAVWLVWRLRSDGDRRRVRTPRFQTRPAVCHTRGIDRDVRRRTVRDRIPDAVCVDGHHHGDERGHWQCALGERSLCHDQWRGGAVAVRGSGGRSRVDGPWRVFV